MHTTSENQSAPTARPSSSAQSPAGKPAGGREGLRHLPLHEQLARLQPPAEQTKRGHHRRRHGANENAAPATPDMEFSLAESEAHAMGAPSGDMTFSVDEGETDQAEARANDTAMRRRTTTDEARIGTDIEAMAADRDEPGMRAMLQRLRGALQQPANPEEELDVVVVIGGLGGEDAYLLRASAVTLHTKATTALAAFGTAAPAEHRVQPDERTTSVEILDENWSNEYLANYYFIMKVGRAHNGQVYAMEMSTQVEEGSAGGVIGYTQSATSLSVNNGSEQYVDLNYSVRVSGSSRTSGNTHNVKLSSSGTVGKKDEGAVTVGGEDAQTFTSSDTSVRGADFGRRYRATYDKNTGKFRWERRRPVDNLRNVIITREGGTDLDVSTWDHTEVSG